jgi:hypothetical protein
MGHRRSVWAIAALAWIQAVPASAYTIQTGLTAGCHEKMTAEAFVAFLDDPAWAELVVPESDTWRKLARPLNRWLLDEALIQEELRDPELFVLFSLVVGVRAPDTNGLSTTDLATQRAIHASPLPDAQYVHALRAPRDDEPEGSQTAATGTRALIGRSFFAAIDAWGQPSDAQIYMAPVTLDFYDSFQVEVWRPAFLLGEAAHALQDSFAHSIRSEASDFRTIVHVLNYVDAIYKEFDESRDGVAHSRHLDRCDETDVVGLKEAGDLAMEDLLAAFLQSRSGDTATLDDLLEEWMTLEEGCSVENDFCDNAPALATARKDATGPILPKWMTCSAENPAPSGTWGSVAAVFFMLALSTRLSGRR